jgi:hypothetical protein
MKDHPEVVSVQEARRRQAHPPPFGLKRIRRHADFREREKVMSVIFPE